MTDRAPEIERRDVRLPDGRRLVYYPFPRSEAPAVERPGPAEPTPSPPRPAREGR